MLRESVSMFSMVKMDSERDESTTELLSEPYTYIMVTAYHYQP